MFTTRFYPDRMFAPYYWPKVGAEAPLDAIELSLIGRVDTALSLRGRMDTTPTLPGRQDNTVGLTGRI